MIKSLISTVALVLACSVSIASADETTTSTSGSNSSVVIGGSTGSKIPNDTPSMGAPSINSTGPCLVSTAGAVAGPGFGFSLGGGRYDDKCNIRNDAAMIYQIVGRDAATEHLCSDPEMRKTLSAYGYCHVYRDAAPAPTAQRTARNEPAPAPMVIRASAPASDVFKVCKSKDGMLNVIPRKGVDKDTAIAACRSALTN